MLAEFRVKNFRSFRDEQVLSLVASNDKALDENCATEGKLRLLKAAGIYGPNASGKSNLISALSTMQKIILKPPSTKSVKHSLNMSVKDILRHIFSYGAFILFKNSQISITHLCGYFITDMQKLPEVRIVNFA